jgi:hypothetical protein
VAVEHALEGRADRVETGVVNTGLGVGGRKPGGEQHRVAVSQGDLERLAEPDDHASARQRAPPLDEAHVPLGGAGAQSELELAHAPALAPFAQRVSQCRRVGFELHGELVARGVGRCHSQAGIAG